MISRLRLDLGKMESYVQTVYVGRGDKNGTTLIVTVCDCGVQAAILGMTASVEMMLSDGSAITIPCTVTSQNVARATVNAQTIADRQVKFAYLSLSDGERVYSTERFNVVVLSGNARRQA